MFGMPKKGVGKIYTANIGLKTELETYGERILASTDKIVENAGKINIEDIGREMDGIVSLLLKENVLEEENGKIKKGIRYELYQAIRSGKI